MFSSVMTTLCQKIRRERDKRKHRRPAERERERIKDSKRETDG